MRTSARTEGRVPPIKAKKGVAAVEQQGVIALLDQRNDRFVGLTPVGSMLWPLIVEGTSYDVLEERVLAVYNVGREEARRDLLVFVAQLNQLGILDC